MTPERKLYLGALTDNRRWDHVTIRADDVIVVTPPKSGTTWMQVIVALLLSGDPEVEPALSQNMPWVDIRFREIADVAAHLEGMQGRRSVKSHTPMDGLPLEGRAQYICVSRHPLDAHFSFRKHVRNVPMPFFNHWYPDDDPDGVTFRRFLDGGPEGFDMDALTLAHILRHYRAALQVADRPNVAMFHYAEMRRNLAGTFARVAGLLGVSYPDDLMAQLVEAATFDNMKQNAERFVPAAQKGAFVSDADFFHKGTNGQWDGVLSAAELAGYDAVMDAALSVEERRWLEFGEGDAG